MSRSKALYAVPFLLLVLIGTLPGSSQASGNTAHAVIGELAVLRSDMPGELQGILRKHADSFRTGVMHPDVVNDNNFKPEVFPADFPNVGHIPRDDEKGQDDLPNWPSEYIKILQVECPDGITNQRCEIALAFLFGALTHMVTDARFDSEFLTAVEDHCGQEFQKNDWAQRFADRDLDICLSKYLDNRDRFNTFENVDFVGTEVVGPPRRKTVGRREVEFCPKGQRLTEDGRCLGCLDGYDRSRFRFSGDQACKKTKKLCKLLQVSAIPNWTEPPLPKVPVIPLGFVAEAYRSAGYTVSRSDLLAKHAEAIPYYRVAEPRAQNKQFQPTGKPRKKIFRCEWGLENFSSADGGLEDSAATVTAFLAKTWEYLLAMYADGGAPVIRRPKRSSYTIER